MGWYLQECIARLSMLFPGASLSWQYGPALAGTHLGVMMDVVYAALSSTGPVLDKNEDSIGFWQPETSDELLVRGSIAALADGVGGHGNGDLASRLAVESALAKFKTASLQIPRKQWISEIFSAANTQVFNQGLQIQAGARMATTLTVTMFNNNDVIIGHVGDCRVFHINGREIRCLTSDHSYVAMQRKLGLITEQEARGSNLRSMLMRTVGQEMTLSPDIFTVFVHPRETIVQCSDGLHVCVTESEIFEVVSKTEPDEACRRLIELAVRRGTDDNLSVQVIRVKAIEQVAYHRGLPYIVKGTSQMSNDVQAGEILDERFKLEAVLGRSGMATIFKATDQQTKNTVAIKVPLMQYESDPAFFSRFEREEEIGKSLDHPYILHIVPVGSKSRPYLVMEYLQGQTLGSLLRSIKRLSIKDSLRIASRLCDALDYMHRRRNNIVHRDLKPENIMICNDGSLRIMDFGIAKACGMRRITFGGFSPTMGTPDYMAPEQVKGQRGDERTDIYSLGAILYEMVTGAAPYEGHNAYLIMNARLLGDPPAPRKLNPDIPPEVEEIILHALERDPKNRFSSAAEMKEELDSLGKVCLTNRAARLKPVITPAPWSHWAKMVLFYVLGPVLLAILGFVILISLQHKQ